MMVMHVTVLIIMFSMWLYYLGGFLRFPAQFLFASFMIQCL